MQTALQHNIVICKTYIYIIFKEKLCIFILKTLEKFKSANNKEKNHLFAFGKAYMLRIVIKNRELLAVWHLKIHFILFLNVAGFYTFTFHSMIDITYFLQTAYKLHKVFIMVWKILNSNQNYLFKDIYEKYNKNMQIDVVYLNFI